MNAERRNRLSLSGNEVNMGSELSGQVVAREIIDGEVNARKRFDPENPQATSIYGLFKELVSHSGKPKRLYSHTDGASRRSVITGLFKRMENLYEQCGGFGTGNRKSEVLERGEDFLLSRDDFGIELKITIPKVVLQKKELQKEPGWRRIISKKLKKSDFELTDLDTIPEENYYLYFSKIAGNSALSIEDEPRGKAALITRYPFRKILLEEKECPGWEYDVALLTKDKLNPISIKILYTEVASI